MGRSDLEMKSQTRDSTSTVKVHSRVNINQTYFNNAPKIMLETISARTATIVLCVTYLTFVVSFLFDLRSTLQGFQNGNQILSSATCSSVVGLDDETFGCTLVPINYTDPTQEVIWAGHVRHFENVISVALQSKFKNVTGVLMNGTYVDDDATLDDLKFEYDLDLYCCYQNSNCGDISITDIGKADTGTDWKLVLSSHDTVIALSDVYHIGDDTATIQLLPNIFQNQETLPDNGKIRSYLVFVTYRGKQPYFQSTSDMTYKFANINRTSSLAARILLQFCIFFTLVMIVVYVRALKSRYTSLYHALPEQRWILLYMIALVLFQNPVYSVVVWAKDPSPEVVFSAYVIDAAAQASFFTLWLILADGWKRQIAYYSFYLPKVAMGLALFGTNLVILILQFPSISPTVHRSPVVAVEMWSKDTKLSIIVFSLSFLSLLWIWAAWWLYNLFMTGRTLHKLPYMSTRYLQLWFRFFTLQATLVTLYYLFQYFVTVYFIVHYVETVTVEAFADGVNTLFRQQSLLFGKVVFLTVYAMILVFFFLPAGFLEDSDSTATSLTATYVLYESEILPVYRTRSRAIRKMKALNQITHTNPYVLCVNLALELLELSWQAYNDPKTYKTESGYGTIDVEDLGYTLLNHAYDSDYDTVCFIFRHNVDAKIVVCFRGTCSKKHWSSNLKYKPHPVDLASMTLDDLNELDGLNLPTASPRAARDGTRGFFDFPHLLSFDVLDLESDEESSDDERPDLTIDDDPDERRKSRKSFAKGVTTAATKVASKAVGATAGLLTAAAAHTPGLENRVQTSLHTGFWEAYCTVRGFIHTVIRQELAARPAHVYCTGHSLGGALATIASLDLAIHTIPRVNKFLRAQRIRKLMELSDSRELDLEAEEGAMTAVSIPDYRSASVRRVKLCVYTYGAPRVGNYAFAQETNHWVPNNFRIVVDGDLVSGVPKTGFKHGGTEIIVDSLGAGSIIIDPSFVEKILRTQNRTSMSVHSLNFYRKGLQGVLAATEYLRQHSALPQLQGDSGDVDGSTARENALIAAQMRLALESGMAAIRSVIFHEQKRSNTLEGGDDLQNPLREPLQGLVTVPEVDRVPLGLGQGLRAEGGEGDGDVLQRQQQQQEEKQQQELQEKHELDMMETDEVAKHVIISQRSFLEVVTDYSLSLWSSLFPVSDQGEDPERGEGTNGGHLIN